jgi:excinuclease ABC subunit A
MSQNKIVVVGARENNLKGITVEIPRDKLVVITGLSGSGKSSLAFDTIYAEGQRRYVESLSSYARQFLGQMDKPDVDHIDGLSPAVSIDQKSASRNPRSTVGTVTEIYDYLRVLYARAGTPYVPGTDIPLERQSLDQIVDAVASLPVGTRLNVLGPIVRGRKGEYKKELKEAESQGYVRVRVDGTMYEVTDDIPMDRYKQHTIEVVVDRLVIKEGLDRRLADSVETAMKLGKGSIVVSFMLPEGASLEGIPVRATADTADKEWKDAIFSEHYTSIEHSFSMPELEPRMFSFNSPFGACPDCTGLGTKTEFDSDRILGDRNLPLRDGAILPFVYKSGETKEWWPDVLDGVGRALGFDAARPVREAPPEVMDAVWNGLEAPVEVRMKYSKSERVFQHKWDGVVAVLRRKYEGTESEWVKQDLEQYMTTKPCPSCHGQRLKPESLCVRVGGLNIAQVSSMSVSAALEFFEGLYDRLGARQKAIAERAVKEIVERLRFLHDVGLNYLSLNRGASTLAGGEAQRIRLATQIGSGLMGCLYVLDEPSIGLHQRDNERLIKTLVRLRDLGNTVLVVEHDEDTMKAADWLIDLGPGAGEHGGLVVNEGPLEEFLKKDSPTSLYLRGESRIEVPKVRRQPRAALGTPNPAPPAPEAKTKGKSGSPGRKKKAAPAAT